MGRFDGDSRRFLEGYYAGNHSAYQSRIRMVKETQELQIGSSRSFYPLSHSRFFFLLFSLPHCGVPLFPLFLVAMSQSLLLRSGSNKKMVASVPKRKIKVPFFENAALIEGYSKAVIGHCVNPRRQDMKSLLLMLPRIWQLEQLSSELAHLRYTRPSYTLHSHRQAGRAIILVKL
ncbi:uncharacterized protein LOC111832059 isoform X4 [Capsella rubella]|uniref:uncharacterized protein LOC111832059 isoform X4 n=1 Tax=Capsella rubella TaxID=81985 RepID=UPI000CD4EB86|nr:uncharacterized protein LOC111832059 isoform X4 [Capsella rubella]